MISRRVLLAATAVILLEQAVPALAWRKGLSTAAPAAFSGNPNVTVTAITSSTITLSRTTGQLPAFFQASASAVTATGTAQPYEDLEYSWTLTRAGGPVAAEIFTNPSIWPYATSGPSVNANTDQTGPEAAFVCRVADTYTVTLNIRGKNGGGFTTATSTATFTASAFVPQIGGEWWCDSSSPNNPGTGTFLDPFRTVDGAKTAWAALASHNSIAIHLKRGSNFVGQSIGFAGSSALDNIRFDAYGAGADPIVNQDGTFNVAAISFGTGAGGSTGGLNQTDIVVSNIQGVNSGTNTGDHVVGLIGQNDDPALVCSNVYFDNVTASTTLAVTGDIFAWSTNSSFNLSNGFNLGFWNCSSTCSLSGSATNRMGFYTGAGQWQFIIGGTITGQGTGGAQDHHIYPVVKNHFICRWINFGSSVVGGTPTRSYCINGDWVNPTSSYSEYSIMPTASITTGVLTVGQIGNASPPFQVGMTLYDASSNSIPNGVTITSFGTGTGGSGTYNISNSSFSIANFTVIGVLTTDIVQYWCIDSNYMFGTQYALDMDDGFNNPLAAQWQNQVCQKNAINGLTMGAFFFSSCLTGTFRDNLAWGVAGAGLIQPSISNGNVAATMAANCRYQVYRNKVYQSAGATFLISNAVTLTATKPIVFTDNQIEDTRTGNTCDIIELVSGQNTTSIIDRNNYLCPNATSGGTAASAFNKDNGVVKTFTQWQALGANFDPNSTATTAAFPVWINPSIGHFT